MLEELSYLVIGKGFSDSHEQKKLRMINRNEAVAKTGGVID
jgi:hypothetical protein